jgi:hypothetical protein
MICVFTWQARPSVVVQLVQAGAVVVGAAVVGTVVAVAAMRLYSIEVSMK